MMNPSVMIDFQSLNTKTDVEHAVLVAPDTMDGLVTFTINTINSTLDKMSALLSKTNKQKIDKCVENTKELINILINKMNDNDINMRLDKMAQDMKIIKEQMSTSSTKSYAAATSSKPKQKSIFVKANAGSTPEDVQKAIKEQICSDKSLQISDLVKIKDTIKITTLKEDTIKKFKSNHNSVYNVQDEKKRDPMIRIIVRTDNKEEIQDIKTRNNIPVEEDLQLIYEKDFKSTRGVDLTRRVYRVSPKAYTIIKENKTFYSGNESTPIKLHFNVRICTHCWSVDHRKKDCDNPDFVQPAPDKCQLCVSHGLQDNLNHRPLSTSCRAYTKLIHKEKQRTCFGNDN